MNYITKKQLQDTPEKIFNYIREELGEKDWNDNYSLYIDFLGSNRCDIYLISKLEDKQKEIRKLVDNLDHLFDDDIST